MLGTGRFMGEEGDLRDCSNGQAPIERAVEIALWKGMAEYLYSNLFPGCGLPRSYVWTVLTFVMF